jgi:hypothetical protein
VVGVPSYFEVPEAPGRHVVASLVDIDPHWLLGLVRPVEAAG